ncbi:MAG: hypothetical protein ACTSRJ_02730, partial [Candidatus Hodarchaeales archaeon]
YTIRIPTITQLSLRSYSILEGKNTRFSLVRLPATAFERGIEPDGLRFMINFPFREKMVNCRP